MWTAFSAIDDALRELGVRSEEFRELSPADASRIVSELKSRYCGGKNSTWWWEHYTDAATWEPDTEGYTLLPILCPDQQVFFIPHEEDDERVYMSSPDCLVRVLGECSAFEYSVSGVNLDWLLTETHHDSLVAVGDRAKRMLAEARNA